MCESTADASRGAVWISHSIAVIVVGVVVGVEVGPETTPGFFRDDCLI